MILRGTSSSSGEVDFDLKFCDVTQWLNSYCNKVELESCQTVAPSSWRGWTKFHLVRLAAKQKHTLLMFRASSLSRQPTSSTQIRLSLSLFLAKLFPPWWSWFSKGPNQNFSHGRRLKTCYRTWVKESSLNTIIAKMRVRQKRKENPIKKQRRLNHHTRSCCVPTVTHRLTEMSMVWTSIDEPAMSRWRSRSNSFSIFRIQHLSRGTLVPDWKCKENGNVTREPEKGAHGLGSRRGRREIPKNLR